MVCPSKSVCPFRRARTTIDSRLTLVPVCGCVPRTDKQRPLYAYLTKSARIGPAGAHTPPQPALRQTPNPSTVCDCACHHCTQHSSVCQPVSHTNWLIIVLLAYEHFLVQFNTFECSLSYIALHPPIAARPLG